MVKKIKPDLKVVAWLNTGIFFPVILFVKDHDHASTCKVLEKRKAFAWLEGMKAIDPAYWNSGNWHGNSRHIKYKGQEKELYFIHITGFDYSDYHYTKLAHEVLHVTSWCLNEVLDITKEHEAFAYTHTHVYTQCLNYIRGK